MPEVTPTGDTTGNIVSFEMWPHLHEFIGLLTAYENNRLLHRLLVWLKARQLGASQTLAAYALWLASYRENSKILVISQGESYAWEFMEKAQFIFNNLPDGLKAKRKTKWARGRVVFQNGSVIEAFPSTEDAGRGWTGTLVIMDEADKHPYLGANFAAVKPVIDAGAQMIMVSTPDPDKLTSPFKEVFRDAPANGWTRIYYGWRARPDREESFRDRVYNETPESQRWRVQYEYSESIEEALAPPQEYRVFDMDVYNSMMLTDVKDPIKTVGMATSIWQEVQNGKRYTAFTDMSRGIGRDYSTTVVLDCTTGYVVADVFSRTLDPDSFAYESLRLLDLYDKPLWAIERNEEAGTEVADAAQRESYPRLWRRHQDTDPKNPGGIGWWTDKDNRPNMWGRLITAFKSRLVTIPNKEGLEQFFQVIRNEKGRVEALEGGNDDYPLAVAGAWYLKERAYSPTAGVTSSPIWTPRETEPILSGW